MKTLFIFGTRPEAIKLIPLVFELRKHKDVEVILCSTGQHREMLDQVLSFFNVTIDHSLNVMAPNQSLADLTAACIKGVEGVVKKVQPDLIFVQGDTTTAFAGGLVGFYNKTRVAHIEAGLRSFNRFSPFPEEVNRKMISSFADFHFCPTENSKEILIGEGYLENTYVVGNTVIDALFLTLERIKQNQGHNTSLEKQFSFLDPSKKLVLVTCHRRENFGDPLIQIVEAISELSGQYPDTEFLIPVHHNPNVKDVMYQYFNNRKRIHLCAPLDYPSLIWIMSNSFVVLTDSGGIQEEAPSLGKPVLVLRNNTERPEGVEAGNAKLVGSDKDRIMESFSKLYNCKNEYLAMTEKQNPYGDGKAAEKIVDILRNRVSV